jgi:hypothetical protein
VDEACTFATRKMNRSREKLCGVALLPESSSTSSLSSHHPITTQQAASRKFILLSSRAHTVLPFIGASMLSLCARPRVVLAVLCIASCGIDHSAELPDAIGCDRSMQCDALGCARAGRSTCSESTRDATPHDGSYTPHHIALHRHHSSTRVPYAYTV